MQPIELILILYGAAALLAALMYIPKLVQFLHCFCPPAKRYARKKRRIALLIPARDESRVIGDLSRAASSAISSIPSCGRRMTAKTSTSTSS